VVGECGMDVGAPNILIDLLLSPRMLQDNGQLAVSFSTIYGWEYQQFIILRGTTRTILTNASTPWQPGGPRFMCLMDRGRRWELTLPSLQRRVVHPLPR